MLFQPSFGGCDDEEKSMPQLIMESIRSIPPYGKDYVIPEGKDWFFNLLPNELIGAVDKYVSKTCDICS